MLYLNMEKVLEIALDNGVKGTRYFTMNHSVGSDSVFFEGTTINGKRVLPLQEAKIWAKNKGYTHLEVIALKRGKSNKTYTL